MRYMKYISLKYNEKGSSMEPLVLLGISLYIEKIDETEKMENGRIKKVNWLCSSRTKTMIFPSFSSHYYTFLYINADKKHKAMGCNNLQYHVQVISRPSATL